MKRLPGYFVYPVSILFFITFIVFSVSCSSFTHGQQDTTNIGTDLSNKAVENKLYRDNLEKKTAQINDITAALHNLEIRMESQEDSIRKIKRQIDYLKRKNTELSVKENTDKIIPESVPKKDSALNADLHNKLKYPSCIKSERLYKKARSLLLEENYNKAAILFTLFIKKYPNNKLSDNAFYWLGECHYSMGDYKGAIKIFKTLVKRYPKGEKVPDALLKTAYAYLSLDDSDRANYYLKQVVTRYPFTDAGDKAALKLKAFQ